MMEDFKFTEKFIQKALHKNWNSHPYKFFNTYFFENESDFLSFLQNGMCYEVEVKISRSDFLADFKKIKHKKFSTNSDKKKFFVQKGREMLITNNFISWDLLREYPELVYVEEIVNTYRYSRSNQDVGYNEKENTSLYIKMAVSCEVTFKEHRNEAIPNKFFYAVPEGLIQKEELPEYAGLLYVDKKGKVKKVRDGKFLHKDKLNFKEALFNKIYYLYEAYLKK